MKYSSMWLVILCCLVFTAPAQLQLGLLGGLNYAGIDQKNMNISEEQNTVKYAFGAMADIPLHHQFSVQLELMYMQKGTLLIPVNHDDNDLYINLNYLELPVFIRYDFGKSFNPYLIAGSFIGINLSSELHTDIMGVTFTANLEENTKNYDYGMSFGGGLSYSFKAFSLFIESRYSMGLPNICQPGEYVLRAAQYTIYQAIEQDVENRTEGLQLMLGISLPVY
jgi:hypothetical protein